jgi:hypothetical protein
MAQDASKGRLGVITRRMFVGAVAGVSVAREHLVLEAIAAERIPQRLVVRGVARSAFFELRSYESRVPLEIFERDGIRVASHENGRVLIPFESLAARERAWREVSADPEWRGAVVRGIEVYRSL